MLALGGGQGGDGTESPSNTISTAKNKNVNACHAPPNHIPSIRIKKKESIFYDKIIGFKI